METIWKYCIYDPICIYKSFEELDEDEQDMLRKFITKSVAQVSTFLAQFPDSQFFLLLCLGDLYRYSFTSCGMDERDLEVSKQCYRKAILKEPNNGRSYNQLALMAKESAPEEAFFLFLRSLIQPKESSQALKNIKILSESKFDKPESLALYNLALIIMFNFRFLV
jgi:tetratricopeptide (TPR) repeat protein